MPRRLALQQPGSVQARVSARQAAGRRANGAAVARGGNTYSSSDKSPVPPALSAASSSPQPRAALMNVLAASNVATGSVRAHASNCALRGGDELAGLVPFATHAPLGLFLLLFRGRAVRLRLGQVSLKNVLVKSVLFGLQLCLRLYFLRARRCTAT